MTSLTICYNIVYFILLAFATYLAYLSYKNGDRPSMYLAMVLTVTLLTEVLDILISLGVVRGYIYVLHLFTLIEYSLFCAYYLAACRNDRFKLPVKLSIPFFVVFGLATSFFVYHFKSLPALNIDVEGFLLFIIYAHLLFDIDIDLNAFIYTHPDFWIAIGVLIFFGGAFFFLGIYPTLRHIDNNKAADLYAKITDPLNIIFYSCITIGQLCLIRNKRYLAP